MLQTVPKVVELHDRKTKTRKPPRALIALRRQRVVGYGMLGAALLISALSTKHQIHGLVHITGDAYVTIMAVVIELGYVALEIAKLVVVGKTKRSVQKTLMIMLVGLIALSAVMNAFAFSLTATEFPYIAMAFGVLVPLLVFGFARVGGPMILARS